MAISSDGLPEISTRKQLGEFTGISPVTLARWAGSGQGPKFVKVGARVVRYRRADVLAWLDSLEAS